MSKYCLSCVQFHCGYNYFGLASSLPFPSPNCCYLDLQHLHFGEKQVNKLHRVHMQLPEDFLWDSLPLKRGRLFGVSICCQMGFSRPFLAADSLRRKVYLTTLINTLYHLKHQKLFCIFYGGFFQEEYHKLLVIQSTILVTTRVGNTGGEGE